jgi:uncharacterized membrane protein YfcA
MDILLSSAFELVSWQALLAGVVAVFVGALIQGATGIGFGMIAAPILMLIDHEFVPGAPLTLAMIISFLVAVRERGEVDWKGVAVMLPGRILGTAAAGVIVLIVSIQMFSALFGAMVLLAIGLSTIGWRVAATPVNLSVAAFVSGLMATLTSIGAPPLALVYQHEAGPVIRSTLSTVFGLGTAMSVVTLIIVDRYTIQHVVVSVTLLPALLLGFKVSTWTVSRVRERTVRLGVLSISATAALILIIRSVSG